jgi:hypothetical protein
MVSNPKNHASFLHNGMRLIAAEHNHIIPGAECGETCAVGLEESLAHRGGFLGDGSKEGHDGGLTRRTLNNTSPCDCVNQISMLRYVGAHLVRARDSKIWQGGSRTWPASPEPPPPIPYTRERQSNQIPSHLDQHIAVRLKVVMRVSL